MKKYLIILMAATFGFAQESIPQGESENNSDICKSSCNTCAGDESALCTQIFQMCNCEELFEQEKSWAKELSKNLVDNCAKDSCIFVVKIDSAKVANVKLKGESHE